MFVNVLLNWCAENVTRDDAADVRREFERICRYSGSCVPIACVVMWTSFSRVQVVRSNSHQPNHQSRCRRRFVLFVGGESERSGKTGVHKYKKYTNTRALLQIRKYCFRFRRYCQNNLCMSYIHLLYSAPSSLIVRLLTEGTRTRTVRIALSFVW